MTSEHNAGLWRDAAPRVPPDSVLRTAGFWWDHFQIEEDLATYRPPPGREAQSSMPLPVVTEFVHSMSFGSDLPWLRVETAAYAATLRLGTGDGQAVLACANPAHPVPECLRWVEADAIARFVKEAGQYPTGPRVALLLLAPFTVVVTADEHAEVSEILRSEPAALDLLDPEALDSAARTPFRWFEPPDSADQNPVGWVRDDTVGWKLEGANRWGMPLANSYRRPGGNFPAAGLLRLLCHVGVPDL